MLVIMIMVIDNDGFELFCGGCGDCGASMSQMSKVSTRVVRKENNTHVTVSVMYVKSTYIARVRLVPRTQIYAHTLLNEENLFKLDWGGKGG